MKFGGCTCASARGQSSRETSPGRSCRARCSCICQDLICLRNRACPAGRPPRFCIRRRLPLSWRTQFSRLMRRARLFAATLSPFDQLYRLLQAPGAIRWLRRPSIFRTSTRAVGESAETLISWTSDRRLPDPREIQVGLAFGWRVCRKKSSAGASNFPYPLCVGLFILIFWEVYNTVSFGLRVVTHIS